MTEIQSVADLGTSMRDNSIKARMTEVQPVADLYSITLYIHEDENGKLHCNNLKVDNEKNEVVAIVTPKTKSYHPTDLLKKEK